MEAIITRKEEDSRSKSSILSLLLFMLLIVALVIPIFSYEIPPPIHEGVLVSFGEPDQGDGNDAPDVQREDPTQKETQSAAAKKSEEEKKEVKKSAPAVAQTPAKVLTTTVEKEVIVPKSIKTTQQVTTPAPIPKVDLEAQRKLEEQQAQAAAAKAAAEEKEKFEKSKKQFGDFLSGSGKGNTNSAGNQGDPGGDPNSEILTGITKGSGRIGGGLSNRGLLHEPEIKDNSQKTGKVVMKVCVDAQGKVIESSFTQRGSTTVDGELREKAKRAAEQYKFSASEIEEQCGTITFDFKVE